MIGLPRTRHRHDRAQLRVARERNVIRWQGYQRALIRDRQRLGFTTSERVLQAGRYYKYSPSCKCCMCQIVRASRKFRTSRAARYRQLDRAEALAW